MSDVYKPFESVCPAKECKNITEIQKWKCEKCKTKSEINAKAMVKCSKCPLVCPIVQCRFACKEHTHDYRKPDAIALAQAVTMMRALSGNSDRAWLIALQKSIAKMVEDQANLDMALMMLEGNPDDWEDDMD